MAIKDIILVPASHYRVSRINTCHAFKSRFLLMHTLGNNRGWLRYLGPFHSGGVIQPMGNLFSCLSMKHNKWCLSKWINKSTGSKVACLRLFQEQLWHSGVVALHTCWRMSNSLSSSLWFLIVHRPLKSRGSCCSVVFNMLWTPIAVEKGTVYVHPLCKHDAICLCYPDKLDRILM